MRRACDACSVRKVQCDGRQPCHRCIASSFDCTFLKSRAKPGPKGPRKRTAEAIQNLQHEASTNRRQREHFTHDDRSEHSWPSPSERDHATHVPFNSVPTCEDLRTRDADWIHAFPAPPSPNVIQDIGTRIPTSSIARVLESYESRAYSIWPVFDIKSIIGQLMAVAEDEEVYGLATALCAAVISQFQTSCATSPVADDFPISASFFEAESRRARICYNHQERMTVWSLLTSFFLHAYAANIGKKTTCTLLLMEAVAIAHILGLHKKSYYDSLDYDQQQYCLRVYWLLYISDRAHSFQHDIPTALHRDLDLPSLSLRNDGSVSANFIHLCTLFSSLDEAINSNCYTDHVPTREAIARAHRRLNQRLPSITSLDQGDEIQRADILMTQQWMRVFLWQYSLSLTNLVSEDVAEEFSLSFPAQVAKTALGFVSNLSMEALEAHGPGMEAKIFEITNALADVMICVPSLTHSADNLSDGLSHRHVIQELCTLLASFRGGNPAVIAILKEKLGMSDFQNSLAPLSDNTRSVDYQSLKLSDVNDQSVDGDGDPSDFGSPSTLRPRTRVGHASVESIGNGYEVF